MDASSHAYVVGTTASATNYPVTATGYQTNYGGGGSDAFLTRMNAAGSALIYSSYLGGNDVDEGYGITLDVQGMTYISGVTKSANFPITPGAFDAALSGPQDVFVAAINTNTAGSLSLVNSTYLGGSVDEVSYSIAIDSSLNLYVPGFTSSTNFPTTAGGAFQTTLNGTQDAFVTKLLPINILQRIIKSFIASRRFNSTIGAGTGTGAAFSIAATTFTNDSGATVTTFPGSFAYYNLYINAMLQEGNTSTVTTTQINIPDGDVLDPATPIVVQFVVN